MKWQDDKMGIEADPDSNIEMTTSSASGWVVLDLWTLVSAAMKLNS